MRRLALALIVAVLTISASGVLSLVVPEPCGANEPASGDGVCPPTCVTCGCCAQAAEPVVPALTSLGERAVIEVLAPAPALPKDDPRDILHVPKLRLA